MTNGQRYWDSWPLQKESKQFSKKKQKNGLKWHYKYCTTTGLYKKKKTTQKNLTFKQDSNKN